MTTLTPMSVTRRSVLAGAGALIVSFSLANRTLAQEASPAAALPGSLDEDRFLDSWIRIDATGEITVFTGKAELGQGIRTALIQVAAEELEVTPDEIHLLTADTGRTPDERYTAGSQSMQNSGTAIRNAAAQVRALLMEQAAQQLGASASELEAEAKAVRAPDGRTLGYGELAAAINLHVEAAPNSPLKQPGTFKVMGRPLPRVDIPAKVTGGAAYVQDLRPDGMLHARLVCPPSPAVQSTAVSPARGVSRSRTSSRPTSGRSWWSSSPRCSSMHCPARSWPGLAGHSASSSPGGPHTSSPARSPRCWRH